MRNLMVAVIMTVLACTAGAADTPILRGAGATFPDPLYQKWIDTYQGQTGTRISYQGVGSGAGIRQILERAVDFGATDAFLSDAELKQSPGHLLHLPTCVGAVAVTYNLPGNPELRLPPDLLADIFLGKVTDWSDRRVARANPGISLPQTAITVVHRSDGSGTTFIFSDYLAKISEEWARDIGRNRKVRWPTGIGVEGNPSVAEFIAKIPGSIGYVEETYAQNHNLPAALLKNRSGQFVSPSIKNVSAAADVALPEDTRLLITDTPARDGYPISAFTYLVFYQEQAYSQRSEQQARLLAGFLWWAIHEGQRINQGLFYAPLAETSVVKAERIVKSMTYNGTPLIQDSRLSGKPTIPQK